MNISQAQVIFVMTGSILIVGGLIAYFLYSMMRHIINYRRLQDGYNRAKLEALEQERQLVAADLHDDIGPILSATLFKLGEIDPVTDREKDMLQQSFNHIDSIFVRIRTVSRMLVPLAIERKGPLYALEEFADKYLAGKSLKMEIKPHTCPGLGSYGSLHLFRMLQEILHNTLKHAKARKLIVKSWINKNELFIETMDDGIGFEPSAMQENPGLGLQNLVIRARMIGARIQTSSWKGRGTRYNIRVGLNEVKESGEWKVESGERGEGNEKA